MAAAGLAGSEVSELGAAQAKQRNVLNYRHTHSFEKCWDAAECPWPGTEQRLTTWSKPPSSHTISMCSCSCSKTNSPLATVTWKTQRRLWWHDSEGLLQGSHGKGQTTPSPAHGLPIGNRWAAAGNRMLDFGLALAGPFLCLIKHHQPGGCWFELTNLKG